MMSASKACTIELMNKIYEIKCTDEQEESLQRAAEKLDALIRQDHEKYSQLDDFQTLLLAALQISHEFILCQNQQERQQQQFTQFIHSLENKIHQVIHGHINQDPETD